MEARLQRAVDQLAKHFDDGELEKLANHILKMVKDKRKDQRLQLSQHVYCIPNSYKKLLKEFGQYTIDQAVEILDSWIENKQPMPGERPTKDSKDALRKGWNGHLTLRRWPIKKVQEEEEKATRNGINFKDYYGI